MLRVTHPHNASGGGQLRVNRSTVAENPLSDVGFHPSVQSKPSTLQTHSTCLGGGGGG